MVHVPTQWCSDKVSEFGARGSKYKQCKLTNNRYTQHEFKLKFTTLSKAYDVVYTENSKNITDLNNFGLRISAIFCLS